MVVIEQQRRAEGERWRGEGQIAGQDCRFASGQTVKHWRVCNGRMMQSEALKPPQSCCLLPEEHGQLLEALKVSMKPFLFYDCRNVINFSFHPTPR